MSRHGLATKPLLAWTNGYKPLREGNASLSAAPCTSKRQTKSPFHKYLLFPPFASNGRTESHAFSPSLCYTHTVFAKSQVKDTNNSKLTGFLVVFGGESQRRTSLSQVKRSDFGAKYVWGSWTAPNDGEEWRIQGRWRSESAGGHHALRGSHENRHNYKSCLRPRRGIHCSLS